VPVSGDVCEGEKKIGGPRKTLLEGDGRPFFLYNFEKGGGAPRARVGGSEEKSVIEE